ncbi:MAG TPA: type III-A CRISPR-associated protein Csm2 [Methylococcaceae bacterium]|nr:type III-A CRISPR-associated protein Csm2 [Methylococcaceae bacterium]
MNYSGSNRRSGRHEDAPQIDVSLIDFSAKDSRLFDEVANQSAQVISEPQLKDANKSTQLRGFYNEVVIWDQKIRQNPEKYTEYLPLVKMLNAKVAYARGRKLVDDNFLTLIRHCISQLDDNDKQSLYTFKLFLEAVMGFHKMYAKK